ncbi:MAG: glutathione S-transferase family protein [Rhodocyclaceae bacterium]|nr:glutathione S-transferase family protein [Rhodocyclaceae bacterium]
MSDYTLVIGSKNYSSWSVRPWLALKHLGLPFREVQIELFTPRGTEQLAALAPARKVPVLFDGSVVIWESLAIIEYLAETHPQLWPRDAAARAHARAAAAEMHAGFAALRGAMPMNIRARGRRVARTPDIERDIARLQQLWTQCRAQFGAGGPYLYGSFSAADAMYAPVVWRFVTYGVQCAGLAADYVQHMLANPVMQELERLAQADPTRIEMNETGL